MAGSSGLPYARAARKAGWLSRRIMLRWALDHLRFRLRGADEEATARVLGEARDVLRGVELKEVTRMTPDVLAAILPRIYRPMLDEVHAHQDAGRATVIVSAAGQGIVATLAQVLDMDAGIGTPYSVGPDGRFNGKLDGPFMYGAGKEEAIERYAAEHGIDLSASWAYSDSASDLPMLRAVGNPVAVNPDPTLARVAHDEPACSSERVAAQTQTSMRSASPWPPPLQIAASPRPPPFRRSSWTIVPTIRPPDAPIG